MDVAVSVENQPGTSGRAFCASVSSGSGEPLAATASRVDYWILVEYRGMWDRDVLGGSLLSAELKAHLRGQLERLGRARLLFVKKPERRAHRRRQLFFGCSRPGEERFYALEFDDHDDLLGIDLADALAGGATAGVPVEHPLFVVCTHGKRDRCCAKFGRPLYDAFRRAVESEWVWQSTHVGGDRFAGNVVALPQALYFGRVEDEDVRPLLDDYLDGRLYLERYRGRAAYPFALQAAEQAVRVEAGLLEIDDLEFVDSERLDGSWRVRFRASDGPVHEVDVVEERDEEPVYLTCNALMPRYARRFRATGHRILCP
jgi:hypothetical protein